MKISQEHAILINNL